MSAKPPSAGEHRDALVRSEGTVTRIKRAFARIFARPFELPGDVHGLSESEEQLRAIIYSASDAIVTIDDQHHITLFNNAAEEIFRCTAEEVVGGPLDRFIPERFRDRHRSFIEEFGRTGVTTRPMGGERVLAAMRTTGEEFPMEARISQSSVGGRKLYTVIIRDVTQRISAADAVRDSEARFKGIIASATDAIITVDEQQRITLFNGAAERMFGYRASDVVGRGLEPLIPERFRRDHGTHIKRFGTTAIGTRTMGGERILVGLRSDGEEFPMEAQISQVSIGGAKLFTVIIRDVTERVRAQQEREMLLERERDARADAETANRAKDDFLSTVSHELRTPLSAMLGWVRLLREGKLAGDRATRALEVIERSGYSQATLIDDLLDLSRIVTGRLRIDVRQVRLADIVSAAVETLRAMAQEKGIDLDLMLLDPGVFVMGDPERLQQIVWNLANNAIKFSEPGGKVDVGLASVNGEARLTVRDAGAGIAPEFLPKLFQPFQQATSVRSRKKGGLGLGLSIVQRLVSLHRGTVTAISDGPGTGTTFVVRLPLAARADAEPLARTTAGSDARRLDGVRVLIVEDDPATLECLRVVLEQCGANVSTVGSAAEARVVLQHGMLDVLVSDIRLPDSDGYTLVEELRAAQSKLPAVAVTAFAHEEDQSRALAAGFHLRLEKPFEPDALIGAIASVASRS